MLGAPPVEANDLLVAGELSYVTEGPPVLFHRTKEHRSETHPDCRTSRSSLFQLLMEIGAKAVCFLLGKTLGCRWIREQS